MISALKKTIAHRSRQKRAALFMAELQPTERDKILDLGGGKGRHFSRYFPFRKNVWVSCFEQRNLDYAKREFGFNTVRLDGTETLPFADREFDIVFCSSVIEHVTGPKDDSVALFKADGDRFVGAARAYQQKFADEVRRIAKRYYVQTPNRYFPVEVHSWIPGLGYMPTHVQWKVIRQFNRFWPRKDDNPDWSLLTISEMRALFPDADIHTERFAGFVKSVIAIGNARASSRGLGTTS